jgi:hypothetical protein
VGAAARPDPDRQTGTRLSKDEVSVEAPYCRVFERESDWEEVAMKIDGTTFGTITIDGKTYEHDVVVRLSGEVVKRKKKLSKKLYRTSHVLWEDEARFLFERGCDQVVIGSGVLYPAVSLVSINPAGFHDHPARDALALASGRLSLLLALEVARTGRATADRHEAAHIDPAHERRKSALGRAAHPR